MGDICVTTRLPMMTMMVTICVMNRVNDEWSAVNENGLCNTHDVCQIHVCRISFHCMTIQCHVLNVAID
jgi:hypothetical protein